MSEDGAAVMWNSEAGTRALRFMLDARSGENAVTGNLGEDYGETTEAGTP